MERIPKLIGGKDMEVELSHTELSAPGEKSSGARTSFKGMELRYTGFPVNSIWRRATSGILMVILCPMELPA
jgi:hypothetical protein